MSQIESQRKHISKTCICKKKKKSLPGIDLEPCSISQTRSPRKEALQAIKYKCIQFYIFPLSLSLSLSVFLWLFNNEAENVGIAICRCRKSWQLASLPVKELVAVRPTPREFLTKGAPGLPSLSHTHTHTQTAKDTWEGPNPLVIISKIRKSPPLRGVVCSQGGANQSG